ncbi:TIGR01777 family oxidoreductase [Salisediminibacterium halotolerans]|uniref:TIGR01777 family protein n=1 Tax=Salisediminibacterium halotolerans TaxID=517425 RepID=A0A1H9WQJ4_9BACI|nr:TIGR01777 family oxidoreductase [Salisediminibacterium haloalkalitolerans]SES36094.1 hypothetical protein SAMN05444126_1431 [Salisediminibacterium haloalkalitolerans]
MKIAVAGGTGLIGQSLLKRFITQGHDVVILTRNKSNKKAGEGLSYVEWLKEGTRPETDLEGIDAFINLAGENLNSGRWTEKKKAEILNSRIEASEESVRIIHALEKKPEVFINGSAVGYYGSSFTKIFTESDEPGEGFLADVVKQWEETAAKAPAAVRTVYSRFGVVLDPYEGALRKMLPAFRFYAGGKLGTGEQWMSWIHVDDVAKAIEFCIENTAIDGPVNFTAPNPEKMKNFGRTLADVMNRPFWAPVPSLLLKGALGEMSQLVLSSQKALPKKLQAHGFVFDYPQLYGALDSLIESPSKQAAKAK